MISHGFVIRHRRGGSRALRGVAALACAALLVSGCGSSAGPDQSLQQKKMGGRSTVPAAEIGSASAGPAASDDASTGSGDTSSDTGTPTGGGTATGSGSAGKVHGACPLLPANSVNSTFGVSGVTSTEGASKPSSGGQQYTCTYKNSSDFILVLVAVSIPSDSGKPTDFVSGATGSQSGVQQISGVGEAAAYVPASGGQQEFSAAKTDGDSLVGLVLVYEGNQNVKNQLTSAAKQVMDAS